MAKKHSNSMEAPVRRKKRKACEKMARSLGLNSMGAKAFALLKRGGNDPY
jgi:hypothetical protein